MRVPARYLGAFGTSIALHLCVALFLVWGIVIIEGRALRTADEREPAITLLSPNVLAPPATAEANDKADKRDNDEKHDAADKRDTADAHDSLPEREGGTNAPPDLGLAMTAEDLTLKFPAFSFDASKIITRATTLFPFLTRDFARRPLALLPPPRRADRSLVNPFSPFAAGRPPLEVNDETLQAMIDESWSRRQRWSAFQTIATIADSYSADEGRLPELLRQYVVQNGLQPYDDRYNRDPRLWAQLGLVADHTDFLAFVSRYADAHPSTRATTELLFLTEKLAQASSDTLLTLIDIEPERDMLWTRRQHPRAFRAIIAIREHYRTRLHAMNLAEYEQVRARFDTVRLQLLENVLRTTPDGYRANDARYLIGVIHWRRQRYDEALRAWRDLRIEPGDYYVEAMTELNELLRDAGGRLPNHERVRRLLEIEHGRWLGRAYDRLQHFGYRFDTF